MTAEIIAVGSELLGHQKIDTNSLFLTRELASIGIEVARKSVLPDDLDALGAAVGESCRRVPFVFLTGGLGPTEDDRTREAAAAAMRCRLVRDPEAVARLQHRFAARGRTMPPANFRQADRLENAAWLENLHGSAPGQWCPTPTGALVLLPGPSHEMEAMFAHDVRPRLLALVPPRHFFTRVLRLAGLTESEVDQAAAPLYRGFSNPATTILATSPGQIELRFQAWAPAAAQAQRQADAVASLIEARLPAAVFSRDESTLEEVVGRLLSDRGETVAVAESCTAGLLGARLTNPAGASRYFAGGIVCYSNRLKETLLNVPAAVLESDGAVSAAVAKAMAEHVRERCATDWGVAITGIAGPDGGSPEKPVGTVFAGFSSPHHPPTAIRFLFAGGRDRIRQWSAQQALNQLRLLLSSASAPSGME